MTTHDWLEEQYDALKAFADRNGVDVVITPDGIETTEETCGSVFIYEEHDGYNLYQLRPDDEHPEL